MLIGNHGTKCFRVNRCQLSVYSLTQIKGFAATCRFARVILRGGRSRLTSNFVRQEGNISHDEEPRHVWSFKVGRGAGGSPMMESAVKE